MSAEERNTSQRLRELEWLSKYFQEHGREDLAQEIFEQVRSLRQRAQDSLESDFSDVIDMQARKTVGNTEYGKV